jgi:hypothetical protein
MLGRDFVTFGPDPASAPALRDRAVGYWESLHPYSAGGAYVNFMMDEGQDRVRATYGRQLRPARDGEGDVRPGERLPRQPVHPARHLAPYRSRTRAARLSITTAPSTATSASTRASLRRHSEVSESPNAVLQCSPRPTFASSQSRSPHCAASSPKRPRPAAPLRVRQSGQGVRGLQ